MTVSFTFSAMHLLLFFSAVVYFCFMFCNPPPQCSVCCSAVSKPVFKPITLGFLLFLNTMEFSYEYSVHFNRMQSLLTLFVPSFLKPLFFCIFPNGVTCHSTLPVSLLFGCCHIICIIWFSNHFFLNCIHVHYAM